MPTPHEKLACSLAGDLVIDSPSLQRHRDDPHKIVAQRPDGEWASLDLRPVVATPQAATAYPYFQNISSIEGLLEAYHAAKSANKFEQDLAHAFDHVDDYADEFLQRLLLNACHCLSDEDAKCIADWVGNFDLYVAVKAIESLINSQADMALLKISSQHGWAIHFDHLAIRCGSAKTCDAERVAVNLRDHHGYVMSQIPGEDHYQFEDGWNAYLLYKILDNGQMLRLFIDQSDADNHTQIIQHWNHVYGYTAHHLAIRATHSAYDGRIAISLQELSEAIRAQGIEIMTPTGGYTLGLLEQVFTDPQKDELIPTHIQKQLKNHQIGLDQAIKNAKLLELLSRKEMKPEFAHTWFELYGLAYDPNNPLHSVPVYNYFLPAQAAHVIRTSVQVA